MSDASNLLPGDGWDPAAWLQSFQAASEQRNGGKLRRLRADVFQETVAAVRCRAYSAGSVQVDLDLVGHYEVLRRETSFHASTDGLVVGDQHRSVHETSISVLDEDCLNVARDLSVGDRIPAVLNMASRRNPGGGVLGGAGAQEENVFRRSNLLVSLYQFAHYGPEYGVPPADSPDRYPIPRESGGIYSPPATIFRSSELEGYRFLKEPYRAAFVTVPAIPNPDVETIADEPRLSPVMAGATCRKIRAIFRMSAHHGHEDLVLSAFGCGAFRNPPRHMAQLFREVLEEPEFAGVFRSIVFAIIDDHNAYRPGSPDGNFRPFADVFA